ncbi:MAG: DUF2797 domain-containing protein [Flavobacteriales bacterium CG_4_10_14_0_2_um_filter_32_8]|nr:MAG: DUF2797 domain-containing protein [Flavobacteriales bacterium CG_4_10_14_0_2_um_filter_32_8]PJB14462.1 MAG: DUF2797 domain-containing protein [Flavobacteriales bacterium CG_4_9_14_3_um_filter_32_8]
MQFTGQIRKMYAKLGVEVEYHLPIGDDLIAMNQFVGKEISLAFQHQIICIKCGRETVKSFNQGFCYSCFRDAPEAADWFIHPEKSKAHLGIEDRNLSYEEEVQLTPHLVYLSLTSDVKVGVTRDTQIPTRWIDQGAVKAIKLAITPNRYLAGMIEVSLKNYMADKTNWRNMLMNIYPTIDLIEKKNETKALLASEYHQYFVEQNEVLEINFPVINYPVKVKSIGFDEVPEYTGKLVGIKGQYLLFANGIVLNIRKHGGYVITLSY